MWHLILKMAYDLNRFFLEPFRAIPLDCSQSTNLWRNIHTHCWQSSLVYLRRKRSSGRSNVDIIPFHKEIHSAADKPRVKNTTSGMYLSGRSAWQIGFGRCTQASCSKRLQKLHACFRNCFAISVLLFPIQNRNVHQVQYQTGLAG